VVIPAEVLGDERLAAAAWSALTEPGDVVAGILRAGLGVREALVRAVEATGGLVPPELDALVPDPRALRRALERWRSRLAEADPRPALEHLAALGGHLVRPGDPAWPRGLDDLGPTAPPCLWVRGTLEGPRLDARSVALVGSRAATPYGERVTAELSAGLTERGFVVVSGGALGVDAAAHRAALAVGGTTLVLLAGGVDRAYPAAHARLFEAVREAGAVLSEVPPGRAPLRSRFLLRNRLVAALSRGTVVVEAAARSGALSTARHAAELLRPLGAVPGPVTSRASVGCHRLLRDGLAVCVTSPEEVAELVGELGEDALAEDPTAAPAGLDPVARRVLDALPVRRPAALGTLLRVAGLGERETLSALGLLELAGLVRRTGDGWSRLSG